MMKVSQINFVSAIRIETLTDAHRIVTKDNIDGYIAAFGDNEVVLDTTYNVYRVPAFAERIAKYVAAKIKDCARFGCE